MSLVYKFAFVCNKWQNYMTNKKLLKNKFPYHLLLVYLPSSLMYLGQRNVCLCNKGYSQRTLRNPWLYH